MDGGTDIWIELVAGLPTRRDTLTSNGSWELGVLTGSTGLHCLLLLHIMGPAVCTSCVGTLWYPMGNPTLAH